MKIIKLIRSLSLLQRKLLADEVGTSAGYLNGLDDKGRTPSIHLVYKIYKSDFNRSLQKGRKFTKKDFVDFVDIAMERDNG